jgi:cyclophilin family peptidyl-prolyl cis-trans isomerase
MIRTLLSSLTLTLALGLPALAQVPTAAPAATPTAKAKPRVQLLTSYGPVVVELEPELAPVTVANFLQYVKDGFYKGTIFHRVIDGFMVQGGGLLENLEEKPVREPILNEAPQTFKAGLTNARGTIAMARTGQPHSASSQFFINVVDNARLDFKDMSTDGYGYCAFGRVVSGMEAIDKIAKVKTEWRRGTGDIPVFAVRLKDAVLLPAQ